MYQSFYDFEEKPFSLTPDPSFLYLSTYHQQGIDILEYVLAEKAGFVLITGEVGTGKTTLIQYIKEIVNKTVNVALVSNTHESMGSILRLTLAAYGLDHASGDPIQVYKRLTDFFEVESAGGNRAVLIVDEAQNLDNRALEELRLLSNFNIGKIPPVQIILSGQPEIIPRLEQPELRQFSQRISATVYLRPLPVTETQNYIRHRLEVAGGDPDTFSTDACAAVHVCSAGLPRLINQVCEIALVFGYGENTRTVGSETVLKACEEMRVAEFAYLPDDQTCRQSVRERIQNEMVSCVEALEQRTAEIKNSDEVTVSSSVKVRDKTGHQVGPPMPDFEDKNETESILVLPVYEESHSSAKSERLAKHASVTRLVRLLAFTVLAGSVTGLLVYFALNGTTKSIDETVDSVASSAASEPSTFSEQRVTESPGIIFGSNGGKSPPVEEPEVDSTLEVQIARSVAGSEQMVGSAQDQGVVKDTDVETVLRNSTADDKDAAVKNSPTELPRLNDEALSSSSLASRQRVVASPEGISVDAVPPGVMGGRLTERDQVVAAADGEDHQQRELVLLIQHALKLWHYNPGPIDGIFGRRTAAALSNFQRDLGLTPDGQPTTEVLQHLRNHLNARGFSDRVRRPTGPSASVKAADAPVSSPIGNSLTLSPQSILMASTTEVSALEANTETLPRGDVAGPPLSLVSVDDSGHGDDLVTHLGEAIHPEAELVVLVQDALKRLGYQPGPVNGKPGSRTLDSIKAFQRDLSLAPDGRPTAQLLERLRGHLGVQIAPADDILQSSL